MYITLLEYRKMFGCDVLHLGGEKMRKKTNCDFVSVNGGVCMYVCEVLVSV